MIEFRVIQKLFPPSVLCFVVGTLPAYADSCLLPEPPNLVINSSFECDGINSSKLIRSTRTGLITGWKAKDNDPTVGETSSFDHTLIGHAEYLAICTVGKLGVVSKKISTV